MRWQAAGTALGDDVALGDDAFEQLGHRGRIAGQPYRWRLRGGL